MQTSPRLTARIAGALYLLTILGGVFAQTFIANRLISFGDANITANNILTRRSLFQIGYTVYLIEMACQVAMTALFYVLLKPVNRNVALVATFLSLAGSVMKTLSRLFYIAPLYLLGGSQALSALTPDQLRALSLILLKVNDRGAALALPFLGLGAVLEGYLIFRSTFLPRFLGVLGIVTSAGWLTFFYPPLGYRLFYYVVVPVLVACAVKITWLIAFGVDEERWKEQYRDSMQVV
jgi:hypothetical protein